jgi:hypothetical protein
MTYSVILRYSQYYTSSVIMGTDFSGIQSIKLLVSEHMAKAPSLD